MELQSEFGLLKQKWPTAKSLSERQDLLQRILEILEESNWIVQQTLQQRFAKPNVAQQNSDIDFRPNETKTFKSSPRNPKS
jgi:hypothetical protein